MNTYSNYSSLNGYSLPGSGTWTTMDGGWGAQAGGYFVDENGNLWLPNESLDPSAAFGLMS